MRRATLLAVAAAGVASLVGWSGLQAAAPQAAPSTAAPSATAAVDAVLKQYCVVCHNERLKTGGLVLEHADIANIAADPELWEKIVRKLQRGAMPPQGARRPDAATYAHLTSWIETALDRASASHPNPGAPLIHRLNRAEYANAIRDLLSLDIDVAALLPADDSAFGFDNIADVLGLSPVLIERYVAAAETISAMAVGEREVSLGSRTFSVPQDRSQDAPIEGLPLGTVGGLAAHYWFPTDAEYEFQIKLLRTNTDGIIGLERPHQLEISVDGKRVFLETIGGERDMPKPRARGKAADDDDDPSPPVEARLHVRVPVQAGPRAITAAFLDQPGMDTRRLQNFIRTTTSPYDSTGSPHIRELTVVGPFNTTGVGDTPTRRRIFTCRPSGQQSERSCAVRIMSTLARRAYRRPVTDRDLEPLLAFYDGGRRDGNFDTGIQRALQRILASPDFVLRVERDPSGSAGGMHRLSDFELASRLSFFLWSSIPDDALLDVAQKGQLRNPAVLERQVRRMLTDPRAEALAANFAGQWLQLRNLRNTVPDPEEFPDFDDQLRQGFARETELFFDSIVREDRSALDLLTADYTFVNERLAKHYGIPFVYGNQFRRVTLADPARRGLLGQGSILTVTSHADRTAPVLRGKWILDNLLGLPPPPPPPNVDTNLPDQADGATPLTMRQRMEAHRANPVCANCHKRMDPIGLAMENFDAVGVWRVREVGRAPEVGGLRQLGGTIDASTQLYDGTSINGVIELRQALLQRPAVIVGTLTEKLLTYALGRGLTPYDMSAVRSIVSSAAGHDYRFSSIVDGIVSSVPFQMRAGPETRQAAAGSGPISTTDQQHRGVSR